MEQALTENTTEARRTEQTLTAGSTETRIMAQTLADVQARQAIAALRRQEPAVEIEIRWCPAHRRIPGNKVADGWAKLAASEPDDHGVE